MSDAKYRKAALKELDDRLDKFIEQLEAIEDDTSAQLDSLNAEPRPKIAEQKEKPKPVRNVHVGHRKRMRASARRDKNLDGFSDVELLELLLSFAVPQRDTNVLAHALLNRFGSVAEALSAPKSELVKIPYMTKNAAEIFGMVSSTGNWRGWMNVKLSGPSATADFFGAVFLGGAKNGTYAAYLDEEFSLISVERNVELMPMRAVVGSTAKYAARNVILVRREKELFPNAYDLADEVNKLAVALKAIGATLLDFILFTDYGYYTVGEPPKTSGEWYPQFIFVPESVYARAPRLLNAVRGYESEK